MIVAETRHLRLLVALADEGSLHAAARRLHVTPSALSQQLRELEQRLGGALFHRQWRRLDATTAGQHLIVGARSIMSELARIEAETRALLGGAGGSIRVAMGCQQQYRWLPAILTRYAALEPSVEVSLVAEAASAPIEWLLSRRLDVALVAGELERDPRLKAKKLFRDELVAVVSSQHPWSKRRRVEPSAFAEQHLFTDAEALSRAAPLGRALAAASNAQPKKVTLVPMNGTVALDLVRANLGITVMPHWTVSPLAEAHEFTLLSVGKRGLWLSWYVATRNEASERRLESFLLALLAHPAIGPRGRSRAARSKRAAGAARAAQPQ